MNVLKAVSVDIDGVLVADTFSPVIKSLVEQYGGTYDRDIERQVFSQNRQKAARYLLDRLQLPFSEEEFIAQYFRAREAWIAEHGGGLNPGVPGVLETLTGSGLRLICYGGLPASHFEKELGALASRFETYICTNDFRPGVAEIVNFLGLPAREVVFVDDVSRVAEAARDQGSPFIGLPAAWPWGYQRSDMEALKVPLILKNLEDLTTDVLNRCDGLASQNYWSHE